VKGTFNWHALVTSISAHAQTYVMLLHMQGTAYEDLEAAKWYEGGHKSTTNEARNSDVQEFWQSCKGSAAGAVKDLTGGHRSLFSQHSSDAAEACL
jgi:hypothetical protein